MCPCIVTRPFSTFFGYPARLSLPHLRRPASGEAMGWLKTHLGAPEQGGTMPADA